MTEKGQAVFECIAGCCKTHKKGYAFPSQETITKLIEKHQGIEVSERTVRRWVKKLKDLKFWNVTQRIKKVGRGVGRFSSNLYIMRWKAYEFMRRLEVRATAFFSVFRRPNLASYQLSEKHGIPASAASDSSERLYLEKDGSKWAMNPVTGDVRKVET